MYEREKKNVHNLSAKIQFKINVLIMQHKNLKTTNRLVEQKIVYKRKTL